MLVCHCHGVSDRTIRESARRGARTVDDVARACGAGRSCGGCRALVSAILESEGAPHRAAAHPPSPTDRLSSDP